MKNFSDFVDTIAKLRSPEGCPWDREQTTQSLLPYLLEEVFEVADSIIREDSKDLKEELGDLLLQIVLHSQIASESGLFTIEDVVKDINKKMISRHPHVFSDSTADTPNEVVTLWNEVKSKEKNYKLHKSHLDKVPINFPPLLRAYKLQKAASKAGFEWKDYKGPLDKIEEETDELKKAIQSGNNELIESEVGDLIFSCVNLARFFDIRSDAALTRTNTKFERRFRFIEDQLEKNGLNFEDLSLDELDEIWEKSKTTESDRME